MATRIGTFISTSVPITPAYSAGWEVTGDATRYRAAIGDRASVLTAATATGTTNANDDVLWAQHIFGPLAAQTLGGNVKGQLLCREEAAAVDARAQLRIYVVSSDGGTVRGVSLEMSAAALSSEFATANTNRKFPLAAISPATLTSVAVQAGDYIVIEQGFRQHGTNASGGRFTTDSDFASDLPEDETTTAAGTDVWPWFEFSDNIIPYTAAAAVVATGTGTANNPSKTVAPTAVVATGTGLANDATVSFLSPPRTLTINSTDRTSVIRYDSFSLVESADQGAVGIGGLNIDDSAAALDVPALKPVAFDDPRATDKRVFTGFTQERATQRGPNKVAGQREWDVECVDLNVLADDYVLSGAGANRGAETDYARITWLLTTTFNTVGGVSAGTVPNSNTVDMDAVDYRGRTPRDVLAECAEAAGKNWFIYYFTAGPKLYYDTATNTNLSSSARISDVHADVDSAVTWAPAEPPVLRKSPDRVYSGVRLKYKRGTVTVTNATTLASFRHREKSLIDLSVKTSTKATAKANRWLNGAAASEKITISEISVDVPAENVNDIRAGHRIELKLSRHGIAAFTWYRILRRIVRPSPGAGGVSDMRYRITLTLSDDVQPSIFNGGRGGEEIWEEKSNATDDGASVIVDAGGITVTEGAITVTNSGATVIIDGESDIFRIAASGSQSVVCANNATDGDAVNLGDLGFTVTPTSVLIYTTSNTPGASQYPSIMIDDLLQMFVSETSGGVVNDRVTVLGSRVAKGNVTLSGTDVIVMMNVSNYFGISQTFYQKYFILEQTAF